MRRGGSRRVIAPKANPTRLLRVARNDIRECHCEERQQRSNLSETRYSLPVTDSGLHRAGEDRAEQLPLLAVEARHLLLLDPRWRRSASPKRSARSRTSSSVAVPRATAAAPPPQTNQHFHGAASRGRPEPTMHFPLPPYNVFETGAAADRQSAGNPRLSPCDDMRSQAQHVAVPASVPGAMTEPVFASHGKLTRRAADPDWCDPNRCDPSWRDSGRSCR